jgi:hypothetical protein
VKRRHLAFFLHYSARVSHDLGLGLLLIRVAVINPNKDILPGFGQKMHR